MSSLLQYIYPIIQRLFLTRNSRARSRYRARRVHTLGVSFLNAMNHKMRDLINLPFSVNAWNAIKFLLLEAIVSLVFAPLWTRYVRSASRKIVENEENSATVFSSRVGRFTPASVMVYRTGSTVGISSCQLDMKHVSRTMLLLVNLLLLCFLLLTEYGSGSRSGYKGITANVTDVQNHKTLVKAILIKAEPNSALTPLLLEPHDYEYAEGQSAITLKKRVRSRFNETEVLRAKDTVQRPNRIGICGISSTSSSCDEPFDGSNVTIATAAARNMPRLFKIENLTKLSAKFPRVATYFHYATGVEVVGTGVTLYPEPRKPRLDCIVHGWGATYQLDYCVSGVGNFDLFFFMEDVQAVLLYPFLERNPTLRNQSNVFYTSGSIHAESLFGIDRRSVCSREVALYQLLLMNPKVKEYKRHLGQSENILMDYFKERFLWALLGMVSGNSAIRNVEVETEGELATLNASFISGCCGIFIMLLILIVLGMYSGPKTLVMPVESEAMLRIMRAVDRCNQRGEISTWQEWPELCITHTTNSGRRLSFCSGEPVPQEQIPRNST